MKTNGLVIWGVLLTGLMCHASAGLASTSFRFLELQSGAREMSMGNAGTAAGSSLSGTYLNPAILGQLWQQEVCLRHTSWIQETDVQYAGYVYPTMKHGVFSMGVLNLSYGQIPGYDASGFKTSSLEAKDTAVDAAYGRKFWTCFWGGIRVKHATEKLAHATAKAQALDIGFLYRVPFDWGNSSPQIGLSFRNWGNQPQFVREKQDLPQETALGLAVQPFYKSFTLDLDLVLPKNSDMGFRAGVEYRARDTAFFRAGYDSRQEDGNGFSFGLGIKAWDVEMNYAYTGFSDLGDAHHVGLVFRFGSLAEKYYERGMMNLRREDYPRAMVEFGKAVSLDPGLRKALRRLQETNRLLQKEHKDIEIP